MLKYFLPVGKYKTQRESCQAIMTLVESYWNKEINVETLIESIRRLDECNHSKIFRNNDYAYIIKERCGKKRLNIVTEILTTSDKGLVERIEVLSNRWMIKRMDI